MRQSNKERDGTRVLEARGWWLIRLQCFDFMPNEGGVIVADVCTWKSIYKEEYVVECEIRGVHPGVRGTWYEGRNRALLLLAQETYGLTARRFKLRIRAKN
eukprot:scaffold48498_cov253-Isochrysis_galbana.AAC.1